MAYDEITTLLRGWEGFEIVRVDREETAGGEPQVIAATWLMVPVARVRFDPP